MRKLLLIFAGITAAVGIAIGGWKVKEQIEHNPMGGINFMIYVNNDKSMYVFYTINKDSETGRLINDGGGNSAKFERLIAEDKK